MSKTVTASEAKNRLGAIMDWAVKNKDDVIIEKRGEPRVVMMAFSDYEELLKMREQMRRAEALAKLQQAAAKIQQNNQDLTEADADALADRIMRDTLKRMVAEGKVIYK